MISRQKLIGAVLPMPVDYGGDFGGQLGLRINRIEFAGFDEQGDGSRLQRRDLRRVRSTD
jgi:hypothetical protein